MKTLLIPIAILLSFQAYGSESLLKGVISCYGDKELFILPIKSEANSVSIYYDSGAAYQPLVQDIEMTNTSKFEAVTHNSYEDTGVYLKINLKTNKCISRVDRRWLKPVIKNVSKKYHNSIVQDFENPEGELSSLYRRANFDQNDKNSKTKVNKSDCSIDVNLSSTFYKRPTKKIIKKELKSKGFTNINFNKLPMNGSSSSFVEQKMIYAETNVLQIRGRCSRVKWSSKTRTCTSESNFKKLGKINLEEKTVEVYQGEGFPHVEFERRNQKWIRKNPFSRKEVVVNVLADIQNCTHGDLDN
ncbi:MAG: hypothetical protein HON90_11400 [Halobacteriovoraceae bacterium]|jgi:hypothetical protein|nr:hypothetical protein [Halobacteriovoraceae bacterium]